MFKDLSALTPPFLMAAAFLIAAGAFVRHEMRGGARNRAEDDAGPDSGPDSAPGAGGNAADQRPASRSVHDKPDGDVRD